MSGTEKLEELVEGVKDIAVNFEAIVQGKAPLPMDSDTGSANNNKPDTLLK